MLYFFIRLEIILYSDFQYLELSAHTENLLFEYSKFRKGEYLSDCFTFTCCLDVQSDVQLLPVRDRTHFNHIYFDCVKFISKKFYQSNKSQL
jgi:hypothetical protein